MHQGIKKPFKVLKALSKCKSIFRKGVFQTNFKGTLKVLSERHLYTFGAALKRHKIGYIFWVQKHFVACT